MSCPKNPKRWLWYRWEGDHEATYENISKNSSGHYRFTEHCSLCGQNPWMLATHAQAVRHGIIDIDGTIIGEGMKVNV